MQIINDIKGLKNIIKKWKNQGLSMGYMPIMDYLYEGYLSLIKKASKNDKIIVSIFVNLMQFGANEDLVTHPGDSERDTKLYESESVAALFMSSVEQMYPKDFSSYADMDSLTDELCRAKREGHFHGVRIVLMKFFHFITPDVAYFGQKDARQCAVVKHMVEDLNLDLEIEICPITGGEDGLAKSLCNVHLNEAERKAASVFSRAIFLGENLVKKGGRESKIILQAMCEELQRESLARIDYIEPVNPKTMQNLERIEDSALGALAVYTGKARLIDNSLLLNLE